MSMKHKTGFILIAIAPVISTILWLTASPLSTRFPSLAGSLYSLGQISGLIGVTLFAVTLVLNTRLALLENLFGGLNKVFPIHHQVGRISAAFIVAHPLCLLFSRLTVSFQAALNFLLPPKSLAYWTGPAALVIFAGIIIVTLWVRLPYHLWRLTHQFIGIAFLLALYHFFNLGSDTAAGPLRAWLIFIAILGAGAYFYRTILGKFLVKKHPYTVSKVSQLTPDIWEITLSPRTQKLEANSKPLLNYLRVGDLGRGTPKKGSLAGVFGGKPKAGPSEKEVVKESLSFTPGQFVFVKFPYQRSWEEQHAFSLTSSPTSADLQLIIKSVGDFTDQVARLRKGDLVPVEGPYGRFGRHLNDKKQLWLAGGIGITPFLSLLSALSPNTSVIFYYSVSSRSEAVKADLLAKMAKTKQNINFILWETGSRGRLTAATLAKQVPDLTDRRILICGPLPMIASLKKQLAGNGVKPTNITSEEFKLAP